jgi:hypothetical protein
MMKEIKPLSLIYIIICLKVLILYIFGINGNLYLGVNFLLILGFLIIFFILKNNLNIKFEKLHFSYIYLLFPYLIYVVLIPNSYFFKSQDEFVWWGASTKWMFDNNHFITDEFPEGQRHYPQGQQLFQYFFLKITFWSEANVLRAQNFFILSAILYTVSELSKKTCLIPVTFVVTSCALYAFQFGYTTIMNDALLGSAYAAAVTSSIKFKKKWLSFLKLAITTLILILLKDIGIVLAIIVISISTYNLFLIERENLNTKKSILNAIVFLSAMLTLVFALRASWHSYVFSINSIVNLRHLDFLSILQGSPPENFELITREFLRRVWSGIFLDLKIFKISILFTTIIFLAYSLILVLRMPIHRHFKSITNLIIYLFGLTAFVFLHLYLYLIWFGDYEGPRLASFERYIGVYYLSWLIILIPVSIQQFIKVDNVNSLILIRLGLIFILIISFMVSVVLHTKHIFATSSQIEMRQEIYASTEVIKKYISTDQKVYFIQQNSIGYEQSLFGYLMRPYDARNWCWSIGEKYYPNDVWSCDRELKELVKDYDYIYIYRADENFWNNCKELFDSDEVGNKTGIYKIFKDSNTVKMVSVKKL